MKLKNHLHFGQWAFYIDAEPEEIRVPVQGFLRTKNAIVQAVADTLYSLKAQGQSQYIDRAVEESKKMKLSLTAYLAVAIEHQICNRVSDHRLCYPGGLGDKIHLAVTAVDDLAEKAPKPVKALYQKVASAVTKKISGTAHKRLSGCGSCGGTRSFSGKTWNLGRSGRMN